MNTYFYFMYIQGWFVHILLLHTFKVGIQYIVQFGLLDTLKVDIFTVNM